MSDSAPGGLELRLPAAALRLWIEGPPAVAARVRALAAKAADVFAVDGGLWVVTPGPGRPAVFDRAASLASHLLAALVSELGAGRTRVLVLPAEVEIGAGSTRLLEDALLEDLQTRPPRLAADTVHLTTHAALGLEVRRETAPAGQFDGKSGRRVPLVTLGAPAPGRSRPGAIRRC